MFLVDTNVFLEALLEQEKTPSVRSFLESHEPQQLFITDLALHSIGIILFRLKKFELFHNFVQDMIVSGINVVNISPENTLRLIHTAQDYSLDFEDAYQYLAAEQHRLQIVSFDSDFDRTELKRKEPSAIIK